MLLDTWFLRPSVGLTGSQEKNAMGWRGAPGNKVRELI